MQTTLTYLVATALMIYAGMGKKQLKLRHNPVCRHCGLRHAPGHCRSI